MLFTNFGILRNRNTFFARLLTENHLKDQLPKDWVAAAEKELKGTPIESLIWRTSEVKIF